MKKDTKKEQGRTLTEILAILAIIGLLSLVGLYGYSVAMRKKSVDAILQALQQKTIEIDSAMHNNPITDVQQLDEFLKQFTTNVGSYQLSFHASTDENGAFISEIRGADGQKIKGRFCRELITKMAEQTFVQDIDFFLKSEEQEDGSIKDLNVKLNNQYVDLDAVCGG